MTAQRLSLLDYAFELLDSAHSPQDFTLILHLRQPPSLENLRYGANSAVDRYPTSGSVIKGKSWTRITKEPEIASGSIEKIELFVNDRFNPRATTPVRQMLVTNGTAEAGLVTRFHHAAADGLSAALWLGHQLSVAYKLRGPETTSSSIAELTLRRSTASVRRSAFAYNGVSDRLWTTNYLPSGARHWLTINFPATDLQRACRRARGFTYSDLLATCSLEVFRLWNQKYDCEQQKEVSRKGAKTQRSGKIGLWYPLNIRRHSTPGFGNGTSRIRLYARYSPAASLCDKAREVRKQVAWSTQHGEWVVPELPLFTRMPRPILAPLLNGYLRQPTVDMATGIFSHADRWAGDAAEAFKYVTRIECIGLLHPRQNLAINGATHQGQTWLTFTYDPALLAGEHVRELVQMYEQQIVLAQKELL